MINFCAGRVQDDRVSDDDVSWSTKQNLRKVGKLAVQLEAICGPKFMSFWDDLGNPVWLSAHLLDYVYHVSFRRYRPLNLPLSCEVVEKRGFGPRLLQEG